MGSAASVRVGWAIGGGCVAEVRRRGLIAFLFAAVGMSASSLVFLTFPQRLVALAGAGPDVVPIALQLLTVTAVFQISDGIQCVGAGVLRGAGETRTTFVANMLGHYGIGLPAAILLGYGFHLGVVGLWCGLCTGLSTVAVVLFRRFWRLSAATLTPLYAAEGT